MYPQNKLNAWLISSGIINRKNLGNSFEIQVTSSDGVTYVKLSENESTLQEVVNHLGGKCPEEKKRYDHISQNMEPQ